MSLLIDPKTRVKAGRERAEQLRAEAARLREKEQAEFEAAWREPLSPYLQQIHRRFPGLLPHRAAKTRFNVDWGERSRFLDRLAFGTSNPNIVDSRFRPVVDLRPLRELLATAESEVARLKAHRSTGESWNGDRADLESLFALKSAAREASYIKQIIEQLNSPELKRLRQWRIEQSAKRARSRAAQAAIEEACKPRASDFQKPPLLAPKGRDHE
jgi:hypothetical protein